MMAWAKVLMVVASVAAGIAGGAIALAAEPERPTVEQAQKALEADLDALHQKGEPVRPEDLARPPVPDAENAVLDLRAAAKLVEASKAVRAYDEIEGSLATPLSRQQADVIRAMVTENAPAMKLIKSAMAKGKVDWQNKYTTPMLNLKVPGLAQQRALANLLRPAALLAHEDGDDVAALEHVRELLFVARVTGDGPFLVSYVVELGIGGLALDVCRDISPTLQLGKEPAMRDQLRRTIAELLDETEMCAHVRRVMQGQRVVSVDTALALASGKLTIDDLLGSDERKARFGRLAIKPADLLPIALADARIMLTEMTKDVDAVSAADLPTAMARLKPWPPSGLAEPKKHFFMAMMLPSLEKSIERHYTTLAQRRLAATALAIRWYAIDHDDKLPKTLQELVPAYLPAVPTDPMTAEGPSLIYSPDDELLYSVGADGQDDGGDPGDSKFRSRPNDIVIPLK